MTNKPDGSNDDPRVEAALAEYIGFIAGYNETSMSWPGSYSDFQQRAMREAMKAALAAADAVRPQWRPIAEVGPKTPIILAIRKSSYRSVVLTLHLAFFIGGDPKPWHDTERWYGRDDLELFMPISLPSKKEGE